MALNLGGIIRLTYTVKNDLGVATNPSAATLTIIQPDGTTATPTVTLPPVTTGLLVVDFTPAQTGLHSVHWATSNPTTAEDDMFVAEAAGRLLVSVDEAVAHLKSEGITTSDLDREKLQWLCLVASGTTALDVSRALLRETVTETHSGGGGKIILRRTPVVSVVTVTESGVSVPSTGWVLDDPYTGILSRGTTSYGQSWSWGNRNISTTYVAGLAGLTTVEAALQLLAARMVALTAVQSMWQTSQQASHIALDEAEAGFAVSSAVAGLPDPLRSAYEGLRAVGIA